MRAAFLILLPLAGCAAARAGPEPAPAPHAGLDAAETVAARRTAFHLSAATFGSMKPVVDAGGEVKPLAFAARGLERWARNLPAMFPAGTNLPASRALPAVWTDRAGFEARAAAYLAATGRLAAAAADDDRPGFAAAWNETRQSCAACHDTYRAEEPR